jgi:hypothetical protein
MRNHPSKLNRRRAIYLIAYGLVVSACATTGGYEKILDTWRYKHADNLVMAWGPPQSTYQLADGGRVLEYMRQGNVYLPMATGQYGTVQGPGGAVGTYSGTGTAYVPVHRWCKTRFVVDRQGYITSWAWEGNQCRARAPQE